MTDPISILGLTFTVVDLLIKHGERTAELISDVRAFESDSIELRNLVQDENLQSKLLRTLLFTKRHIYGGRSLFEEFDADIQQQICLLCEEIESILKQGIKILERRYGVTREDPNEDSFFSKLTTDTVSRALSITSSSSQNSGRGHTSPGLPSLLVWSLRDKKRVVAILYAFKDRNARLKKKIELWCFASQLGVSSEHLRHLQTDESSKRLGFDQDASLRLNQGDADRSMEPLELVDPSWDTYLKTIEPIEHQGMFAMFSRGDSTYIQENHHYELPTSAPTGTSVDPRTRSRVESLARLLHQPKERVFRVLPCLGWKYLPDQASIAFIFEVQPKPVGKPVSLQRLLFHSENRPELGDKFRLALGLANCIAQMHMVQWVHESFRSDNILLLPHTVPDGDTGSKVQVNYSEPWVLGFEFSRPEPFFSAGQADFEPTRDIYRHPDRQGEPVEMFNKIHDIYALGVVLLEIGLWDPAAKLDRNMFTMARNPGAVQAQLIKHAERRLESRVGKKYTEIVIKCLTGEFGVENDTKEDLRLQQAFRHQVVDVIENAANFV
ncbi:hypothetical protein N7492_002085 [Penicillium capsulatum]|uniref:DUF7580 domain-containing protein n=1 Tax=Penicillium capsulatum TaxID=69766 RepID=A0A9W9IKU2_9EURO|nr:hypothetical protein N7492_002085 [Penicillium capsulatum]KAJ6123301.1 hypothetical protein N7512_005766 [Penicillium capsulatum]